MRHKRIFGVATPLLFGAALLAGASNSAQAGCGLQSAGNKIKHVVHIQFDNLHLRRDNPNVPSDLEQMPNLLNFMQDNGTVSGNHHTPLISHTATDILTVLTGAYGDRMGVPVSNSYGYFRNDGSVGFSSSFLYWTALSADGRPLLINENGKTFPAPWVPFTRAGCDVGAFSIANMEFESLPADVSTVYGTNSPEYASVFAATNLPKTPANAPLRQAANTDWLGIAVHCAQGSALCNNSHAKTDALPDEPGGYTGFSALYGNVNVAPVICTAASGGCEGNGHVKDTEGDVIADAYGRPGFPNIFNPLAKQSLGYAATMLEAGVPVVYVYVADAHDRNPLPLDSVANVPVPAHAFGPGESEYVAQLTAYDVAFGKFFARLAADGITKDNTLFIVTADENDHFVGGAPCPAKTGSIYPALMPRSARSTLSSTGCCSPSVPTRRRSPSIPTTRRPSTSRAIRGRQTRRRAPWSVDVDALQVTNPITGRLEKLNVFLADRAEMNLLHMITSSPARSPSFTMFGNPDYFNTTSGLSAGDCSNAPACVSETPGYAWNHGDFQKEITRTWMGMVGPGVIHAGRDDRVFSDHTDLRPTMIALAGLKDDYAHDGRVLIEFLDDHALPKSLRRSENFLELAQVYKQLNAPLGSVGLNSLRFANRSILGDDAAYNKFLADIADITTQRNAVAAEIKSVLDAAAFDNKPIDEHQDEQLVHRARAIIDRVADLAQRNNHDQGDDHH
jgi:hypothetical protein